MLKRVIVQVEVFDSLGESWSAQASRTLILAANALLASPMEKNFKVGFTGRDTQVIGFLEVKNVGPGYIEDDDIYEGSDD